MNGFEDGDLLVTKIMQIPKKVENFYKRSKNYKLNKWPYYVYGKDFFKKLGAQFRTVDNQEQMLLKDIVYEVDDYKPCSIRKCYSIGSEKIDKIQEMLKILPRPYEDIWNEQEMCLLTMIGMLLVRCQQIEHYMSYSFLLGCFNKKERQKNLTINDLKEKWKRKTFGSMLKAIDETWDVNPLVRANFELFLIMRNQLVHGITTSDRYNIRSTWGQMELLNFLSFFDVVSLLVKKALHSSFLASICFGMDHFSDTKDAYKSFKKKEKDEIQMFFEFFTLKQEAL